MLGIMFCGGSGIVPDQSACLGGGKGLEMQLIEGAFQIGQVVYRSEVLWRTWGRRYCNSRLSGVRKRVIGEESTDQGGNFCMLRNGVRPPSKVGH